MEPMGKDYNYNLKRKRGPNASLAMETSIDL